MKRLSLLLVGLALGLTAPVAGQAPTRSPTIAVLDFNNSALTADAARYEPFRAGLADILLTELSRNGGITLVERGTISKLLEEQDLAKSGRVDPATAARLGKLLGAQYMITGGFVIDRKERLRLDARAVNVETSAVAHVETVSGSADDLLDLTAKLAEQMNKGMKLPAYAAAARSSGGAPAGGRLQSLLLYSTALIEESRDPVKAKALYAQFLKSSPADFAVDQRTKAEARLRALGG
jgi:TolB-like protein